MQKKTIGILTFHTALNYGAVLQACALKIQCDNLGYEAHIINYCPEYLDESVAPFNKLRSAKNKKIALFKYVRAMLSYLGDKKREKEFIDFRHKYLDESVLCKNCDDVINLGYDIYISGSDQIWNYKITGDRFDTVFFLNFDSDAKKIIYAASSQDIPFPLDFENDLRKELVNSNAMISIREKNLSEYASSLSKICYPVVLDPTLLAGKEFIDKIEEYNIEEKEFILIYQIDANPLSDICVKNLEQRFKCPVYTMTVPRIGNMHGRKGDVGPEKFLGYLKKSKFLVTNSFHGIALSLLLHKQFYVYENGGVMTRIDNLLDTVQLSNRKVKMVNDIDTSDKIDFDKVDQILSLQREKSLDFLTKALDGTYKLQKFEEKSIIIPDMRSRNKKDCSGCSSCADACPVSAINMMKDNEGFLYPHIDEHRCIHCGICDKACGFEKRKSSLKYYDIPKAYGIKHKNQSIRDNSRSGAAFIAFSDVILSEQGVVYGAVMDNKDFSVSHIRAVNSLERDRMQKAKYVQSNTVGVYPLVLNDLLAGKYVMFSGTPCQVSGLQAYLKIKKVDTSKLVCCDLVCHGVPSPEIWKKYTEFIENRTGGKILVAEFRDKEFGWDSHCESFILNNRKKKYVSRDYTDLFYYHLLFRPSCYNCQFANIQRVGDITLADFWGIEKNKPEFNDNRGTSLILVNSAKGEQLFERAKSDFEYFACNIENCMQPTLYKASTPSGRRDLFWKDYSQMEFAKLMKKYTTPLNMSARVKRYIKIGLYKIGIRKHP